MPPEGAGDRPPAPEPDQRISADIDLLVPADQLTLRFSPGGVRATRASLRYRWTGSGGSAHRSRSVGDRPAQPAPHLRGPYGHLVDLDELAASTVTVEVDGVVCSPSDPNSSGSCLLHIVGGVEPRLGDVRDLALLLDDQPDVDRVMRTIVRWEPRRRRCRLRRRWLIGARHPIIDWAGLIGPQSRSSPAQATQIAMDVCRALASLTVVPWRDKPVVALTSRRLG